MAHTKAIQRHIHKILAETTPNLEKDMNIQIQEAFIPTTDTPEYTTKNTH